MIEGCDGISQLFFHPLLFANDDWVLLMKKSYGISQREHKNNRAVVARAEITTIAMAMKPKAIAGIAGLTSVPRQGRA